MKSANRPQHGTTAQNRTRSSTITTVSDILMNQLATFEADSLAGNDEPQGFGHLAISVDDLDAGCSRFEELGVKWKKRLIDGRMKNVAFLLDPDGYWIEIIQVRLRIWQRRLQMANRLIEREAQGESQVVSGNSCD